MNDINIIEELGIKEVSKKTHIEAKFLHFMITKQFGKLNKTNTLGFVKILRREYNLDLRGWVEEFEAYIKEHEQTNDTKTKNPLFTQENNHKKSNTKIWLYFSIFILLVAFAFWKFNGMKFIEDFKHKLNLQTNIQKPIVDENISDIDIVQNEDDENILDISDENITEELNEQNITQNIQTDEIPNNETLKNTDETQQEQNTTQERSEEANQTLPIKQQENIMQTNDDENISTKEQNITKQIQEKITQAFITPKRKMWIGIIDLKTHKKKQYSTQNMITLQLNHPQLIMTGHGDFIFKYGNEENSYTSKLKKYYIIKNGTIKQIDKKEFIANNKGKSW